MAIAETEKKLWQNQAKANRYRYHLWLWRKNREAIITSIIILPLLIIAIRTMGGARLFANVSRQVSSITMAFMMAWAKNSLFKTLESRSKNTPRFK